MLKFTRKNKNLKIPVGIGTNNNVDSSLVFNVSNGDATAGDLVVGKTAYSAEGFLVGTLDLEGEKTSSYNEGYSAGEQDGYISGEADGYADGYAEGKEDGIEEIISEQSDANITPGSVLEGYIGYGANNERIVGTNVGGFNFSEIGYTEEESNKCNLQLKEPLEYTKSLMPIEPSTNMNSKFAYNNKLVYAPYIDTSITTSMVYMFNECSSLKYVPLFNTSNVTDMRYMFQNCTSLTTVPSFNTFKATNTYRMFSGCTNIKSFPNLYTANVTNMGYMFYNCTSLENVESLYTYNATDMSYMFYNCRNLTGKISINFSNCTNANSILFLYTTRRSKILNEINISNITNKLTDLSNAFYGANANVIRMEGDTSNVTNMGSLFRYNRIVEAPDINTSAATDVGGMFNACEFLQTIPTYNFQSTTTIYEFVTSCPDLMNVGGLTDLGKGFVGSSSHHTLRLNSNESLTRQSYLNIFNSIYDMNLTSVTDAKIIVSSAAWNYIDANDVAIATNKGWTIQ